jgi:hypothetical protein
MTPIVEMLNSNGPHLPPAITRLLNFLHSQVRRLNGDHGVKCASRSTQKGM